MDVPKKPPPIQKYQQWSVIRPTLWWDMLLWSFLLWGWAIPSAYFWHLTETHHILLPYIPRYFWKLPGELWQAVPWLFAAFVLIFPLLFAFLVRKRQLLLQTIRF